MTEQERQKLCSACIYHTMNGTNRSICNITRQTPDFEVPCRNFTHTNPPYFGKFKSRMLYYNAYLSIKLLRKNKQKVTLNLMQKGLNQYDASYVVANIVGDDVDPEYKRLKLEAAKKNLLYGGLWCLGGLIFTGISYAAASNGGTYVIATGAIVVGGLQFIKGIIQLF